MLPLVALLAFSLGTASGDDAAWQERLAETDTALASATSERDETAAQLADAQAEIAVLEQRLGQAEARATNLRERVARAEERARAALESDRASMEAELAQRAAALDEREADITQAEQVAAMSTFGSGTWKVGDDILPGTYRAPGGSGCYWARLRGDGDSIIQNHYQRDEGQVRVVIQPSDGFFESRGCGQWTRA